MSKSLISVVRVYSSAAALARLEALGGASPIPHCLLVVGDGERGAVEEGVGEDCGAHAGGGVVVVGEGGGVGYADDSRFDGEGEEGAGIRGDGGWDGDPEEGGEECRVNASFYWREVFSYAQHYAL